MIRLTGAVLLFSSVKHCARAFRALDKMNVTLKNGTVEKPGAKAKKTN
jgi:hypothetical protein